MAYVKKYKTDAERRLAQSIAGKKGADKRRAVGYANVGRKKGWTKDPALKAIPAKTLTVREPDYQVYVKCAFAANVPIVEFMHLNAEALKKRNPQLFAPDAPVVEV